MWLVYYWYVRTDTIFFIVAGSMFWTLDKNSLYPPENPSEFGFCHNHAYTSGTMCFL